MMEIYLTEMDADLTAQLKLDMYVLIQFWEKTHVLKFAVMESCLDFINVMMEITMTLMDVVQVVG
jgi:hypothetical protein